MKTFKQYLNELLYSSYDNKVHKNELFFIRTLINITNDVNPDNNYKIIRTEHPITITFGDDDKSITIENIIGVKCTGKDVKNNKKADFILFTDNGEKIPISVKHSNFGNWSKYRTIGELFKKYLINKGEDITIPRLYRVPDAEWNVFGSDIKNGGFVFKATKQTKDFVKEGLYKYKIHGKIMTTMQDIDTNDLPVLVISKGSIPNIRTKGKNGKFRDILEIPDEFLNRYKWKSDDDF